MDIAQRISYLPRFFHTLLTAAAMNNASLDEVDDWWSCGVLLPPGRRFDNPLTALPADLLAVLWNVGIGGCLASDNLSPSI